MTALFHFFLKNLSFSRYKKSDSTFFTAWLFAFLDYIRTVENFIHSKILTHWAKTRNIKIAGYVLAGKLENAVNREWRRLS